MSDDWNIGKQKVQLRKETEMAVVVGLSTPRIDMEKTIEYLDELEFLASTAGAFVKKRFIQKLNGPNSKTYVGKGKVEEIGAYVEANEIEMVIFDDDLTVKQISILEKMLNVKILDRSNLILDIFARRAQTAQAKVQVELAQMQYLLPRLRGMWDHLERQKGGIGMRGPGEKEIETDRRIVRDQISVLKKKLSKIDLQAQTQRKNRGEMIRVSLVGYTNVGKSTIMNVYGKAEVLAEDKLFATLDTTVRKVVIDRMPFLLSDTVGFIRKLPHHLVESFKSTLDEVRESDLLIHVIDISHPQYEDHIQVVKATLKDLGVEHIPTLYLFNKLDLYQENHLDEFLTDEEKEEILSELIQDWKNKLDNNVCFISAKHKIGLGDLRLKLKELIAKLYDIRYPYKSKFW